MYFEIAEKNYAQENKSFKDCINPLVDYVFNSNKIVFGYRESNEKNFENQRYRILSPYIKGKIDTHIIDIDYNGSIGIFEQILRTHIQSQDYSVLILTGASGSGKTSIIKYIGDYYDACNKESCLRYYLCRRRRKEFLYYDFLEGKEEDALIDYDFRLNALLMEAITVCFDANNISSDNMVTVENLLADIKIPSPQLTQLKYILYNDKISENTDIGIIISKIQNHFKDNIKYQNLIFIGLLQYIRNHYPQEHKGCFTIIFDNIDRLPDEKQIEIIKNIVSLHNSIKCKIVISARLTTFDKFNDFFSNTTGLVEHAGPAPIDIIYHRIKYYYENKDTLEDIIDIRKQVMILESKCIPIVKNGQFLDCFDKIILTLLKYLSPIVPDKGQANEESRKVHPRKKRLQGTLNALSGLSVRRGLELAKRFFDPLTYSYHDEPSVNQLMSSLTYTCSRGIKFKDSYVTNLFARYDDNRRNSWLLYRILNILSISQDEKLDLTIYQLYDIINLYEKEELKKEVLINAINVLIDSNKRIAYLSGIAHLKNEDWDRTKNRQKIHITISGKEYFSFLATELSYIQNCFAALDWKTIGDFGENTEYNKIIEMLSTNTQMNQNDINILIQSFTYHSKTAYMDTIPKVFNTDIVERMEFVRNGIEILLYHDITESYYFNKNINDVDKIENISSSFYSRSNKINSFPTLRLLVALSESFLSILTNYKNPKIVEPAKEELKKWKELLYQTDLWNKCLCKTNQSYTHVEKCKKDIEGFIDGVTTIENK
ncbi:MAG: hypothetical protein LBG80_00970 [Bacteroidales bacterium]|jgi:hypothetical protein|nr:hypothetical protein [Bacteroidales bacterium]